MPAASELGMGCRECLSGGRRLPAVRCGVSTRHAFSPSNSPSRGFSPCLRLGARPPCRWPELTRCSEVGISAPEGESRCWRAANSGRAAQPLQRFRFFGPVGPGSPVKGVRRNKRMVVAPEVQPPWGFSESSRQRLNRFQFPIPTWRSASGQTLEALATVRGGGSPPRRLEATDPQAGRCGRALAGVAIDGP